MGDFFHLTGTYFQPVCTIIKRLPNSSWRAVLNQTKITFIRHITDEGERTMVDIAQYVLKYFYRGIMKSSSSIKVVLPAILNAYTAAALWQSITIILHL